MYETELRPRCVKRRERKHQSIFILRDIWQPRESSDHQNNIRNPVVECSLSRFGYEHLVTTFTWLNIACGILYGKDNRNRPRLNSDAWNKWNPKQGLVDRTGIQRHVLIAFNIFYKALNLRVYSATRVSLKLSTRDKRQKKKWMEFLVSRKRI